MSEGHQLFNHVTSLFLKDGKILSPVILAAAFFTEISFKGTLS
jgi:hypothetical protein